MLEYRRFEEIVEHPGLRIVLVKGMPSPWGQAAKTIFEIKGLEYVAAPWQPGEPNESIVAWGGEASAPVVAWAKEKPINRWINILYLAERLAPTPSMIPADATQRALMSGCPTKFAARWVSAGTVAYSYLPRRMHLAVLRQESAEWEVSIALTKETQRPLVNAPRRR
jgi:hypothetical protein